MSSMDPRGGLKLFLWMSSLFEVMNWILYAENTTLIYLDYWGKGNRTGLIPNSDALCGKSNPIVII